MITPKLVEVQQHRLTDCLNWLSDHIDESGTWSDKERVDTGWACRSVGTVTFSTPDRSLAQIYPHVARQLVQIVNGGYLDWVVQKPGFKSIYGQEY